MSYYLFMINIFAAIGMCTIAVLVFSVVATIVDMARNPLTPEQKQLEAFHQAQRRNKHLARARK